MNSVDQKYYDDFAFNLRCKLTSDLILKYKEHKYYNNLLTLIKSDLYEDLILAQEIMNKLAI